MSKQLVIIFVVVIFNSFLAKETYSSVEKISHQIKDTAILTINQDIRISKILKIDSLLSSEHKGFFGYRVQIYSESSIDTGVRKAKAQESQFKEEYPDIRIYLKYIDPDFKIRVGNFRTRLESVKTLKRIKRHYPNCYVVKTFISFKELEALPIEAETLNEEIKIETK